MARTPQKSITLDEYHLWAVDRVAAMLGTSRSDIVLWAVREWMRDYQTTHVVGAKATSAEFAKRRGTKQAKAK